MKLNENTLPLRRKDGEEKEREERKERKIGKIFLATFCMSCDFVRTSKISTVLFINSLLKITFRTIPKTNDEQLGTI